VNTNAQDAPVTAVISSWNKKAHVIASVPVPEPESLRPSR